MIGQAAGIGTPWRALLCALAIAIARNGRTHIGGAEFGGVSAAAVVPPAPSNGGAPVELCPLFGGSCCRNCSIVLRHRWNITLCLDPEDQCCISEHCSQEVITSQRPADDVSAGRTECDTEGGTCQAWWHHCEGAKVARRCGYIWQSCCNTTKVDGDILGESATSKRDGANINRPWLSWHRSRAGQRGSSHRYPTLSDTTKAHDEEQQDSGPSEQSRAGVTCGVVPATANDNINAAAETEWPWQARVETESGIAYCTGIVVDRLWVLTSASCFSGMTGEHLTSHRVVVGRRNLNSTGSGYQTYAISAIFRHPYYGEMYQQIRRNKEDDLSRQDASDVDSATRPDGERHGGDAQGSAAPCSRLQRQRTILHDQAMLRLAEAIAFDEYASPACLPTRRARSGRHTCSVSGLVRHSRQAHGAHSEVSGEAGAESQRRAHHTAQGKMHDSVFCGKLTGNEGDSTQMCFERDNSEVLSQLLPGAFVTCLSDEGQHVVAAMNSGNFHHCHGKAMSVVTALPPNSFWIRNVIESSTDASGEAEQPALEGSPPSV